MAKNVGGYLGIQRGKLGGAVGRVWRGQQVYSVYTNAVKNPRTEAQQAVRAKFSALGKLCRALQYGTKKGLNGIRTIWDNNNAFMHINWDAVSGATAEEVAISYADVKLSQGICPAPIPGALDLEGEAVVKYPTTDTSTMPGASETDMLYTIVYQPNLNQAVMGVSLRGTGSAVTAVEVPAAWSGMRVQVYAFCVATEGDEVVHVGEPSDTVFVGTGNIG